MKKFLLERNKLIKFTAENKQKRERSEASKRLILAMLY
jgi:hypothetical protein